MSDSILNESIQIIGKNIKNARKSKHLTQKELAEKVGVSNTAIMRYEKAQRSPNNAMFEKIAEALDVTPSDLMPESYKPKAEKKQTISGIFEEIQADICDNYCKYPSQYTDSNYDRMLEEVCSKCPLNRL